MIRAAALVVLVGLHSTAEARGPETRPSPETRPNPKVSDIPPRGEVSVEHRPFPHREVSVEPRPLPPRFSKVPDFGRSRGLHDGHRPTDFPRKDGPDAPPSDLVHSDKPPLPPSGFPQGPAGELLPLPSDLPQGPPGELTPHASTHPNFGKRGLRGGRQAEDFPPKDGPVGPPSNLPRFPEGPTGGLPPLPSDLPQKPPGELPPLPSDLPLHPGHPGEEEPHRLPGEEEPHPFPLDQSDRPPLPSDLPPRPLIHPPHSHGPQHAPVAQPSGALRGLPPKPDFLQSSKRWEPLPFPLFADHSLPAGNNPAEPRGPPPHSAHPGAFDFPPFANDDIPRPADGPAPPQGPPRVRGRP